MLGLSAMAAFTDVPFSPRASQALAAACLGVACVLGCPGPTPTSLTRLPSITSTDPKAESELASARELDERGDDLAAADAYRAFVRAHPKDPLAPVAKLGLARILVEQGKPAEARLLLIEVGKHHDPALAEQGRFYGAVAAQALGDHDTAVATLEPMIGHPIDPADTALLLSTLADALSGMGRHGDAIAVLDKLASEPVSNEAHEHAKRRIAELARDKASPVDIERLSRELDDEAPAWEPVMRRALRDADAAGNTARTQELLEQVRDAELRFDEELSAIAQRAEQPAEADPQVIGAVLSLSGRGRRVGELAMRGLMLAAGLPLSGPPPANAPRLVFRDDGGEPERAAEAVADLVTTHRAIAIVGPLDVRCGEAAAQRAQELGVPIVLLSPGGHATRVGAMVHRLFVTPDGELRSLLARAKQAGRTSVAALLPEGAYGDLIATLLREQASAEGFTLAHVERYASGSTGFAVQTEALAKHAFDTLLLADDPNRIALIAPALAAAGLWSTPLGAPAQQAGRAVTLLLPSVAFDNALQRMAGRYLNGAVFSAPFDPEGAASGTSRFAQSFRAQFGSAPDAFAAFAHDAYGLLRKAIDAGARTRAALALALTRVRASDPATPSQGFGAEREALTPTRLVQLTEAGFVPLD
jgi:ABC-type branched-subunit amino acid transport system substrate-binding protein